MDRIFQGYKARDVTVVVPAREALESALPGLVAQLSTYQVARIHLALAASAAMEGKPDSVINEYLHAAYVTDERVDIMLAEVVSADDDLMEKLNGMRDQDRGPQPGRELPPAWSGKIWVNGRPDAHPAARPYLVQIVDAGGKPAESYYEQPADVQIDGVRRVAYTRLRPVQGGLIAGAAAAAATTFVLGAWEASRVSDWDTPTRETMSGAEISSSLDDWSTQRHHQLLANHALIGTSAVLGAATIGLGVWWATSF